MVKLMESQPIIVIYILWIFMSMYLMNRPIMRIITKYVFLCYVYS